MEVKLRGREDLGDSLRIKWNFLVESKKCGIVDKL